MDTLVKKDKDTTFFLCTDDPDTKKFFCSRYKNVITYDIDYSRKTTDGVKDALMELLTLAQTRLILGSYYSSYTQMASEFNLSDLLVVK